MKDKKSSWHELVEGVIELIIFMGGFVTGLLIFLKHFVYQKCPICHDKTAQNSANKKNEVLNGKDKQFPYPERYTFP